MRYKLSIQTNNKNTIFYGLQSELIILSDFIAPAGIAPQQRGQAAQDKLQANCLSCPLRFPVRTGQTSGKLSFLSVALSCPPRSVLRYRVEKQWKNAVEKQWKNSGKTVENAVRQ